MVNFGFTEVVTTEQVDQLNARSRQLEAENQKLMASSAAHRPTSSELRSSFRGQRFD